MALKNFTIVDDIHNIDRSDTLFHLHDNAMLSVSYVILLAISTIICTLGLLLDSPAIVIGGMIISPLMWPLMKIAAGISLARQSYITQSLYLLVISILISLASSFIITLISPLKVLSPEILSRTQPTLLDIVIALSAGTIAAFAIVHKKISSSLAGVAIATSLLPPLCVGGIGLALLNTQVLTGGLLLFIANVISIIFAAIFVFRIVGIETHVSQKLQSRGIMFVAFMLFLTAFPLFFFLRNYSFEAMAYQKTQNILNTSLKELSPLIHLENVKTKLERSKEDSSEVIRVEASIVVPEDLVLGYKQKELLIGALEKEFQKNVILNLRIQKAIALQTETDIYTKEVKDQLTDSLLQEIALVDNTVTVDSLSVYLGDNKAWIVDAVFRSDPSISFTESQRSDIEKKMQVLVSEPVFLELEIISRISLRAQRDILIERIEDDIREYLLDNHEDISIIELNVSKVINRDAYDIYIVVTTPPNVSISKDQINDLKILLGIKYRGSFRFVIDQIEKNIFEY